MATLQGRIVERRVVRQIDVASAARLAFALSVTLAAILLVGLTALYLLGLASGAVGSVESFVASLGWDDFRLRFFALMPLFMLLAAMAGGFCAVMAAVLAILYNTLSDIIGGVEITTRER
jgi:hypothetical protein